MDMVNVRMSYKSPVMTMSDPLENTLPVIRCVAEVENNNAISIEINN